MTDTRPTTSEYDPFYSTYVEKVPAGDIVSMLVESFEATKALLKACPKDREQYRYLPGKMSTRELVGHVIDAERMYTYRILHIAREDPSRLPGVDPMAWVASSNASQRPLLELIEEFAAVRAATVGLLGSLDEAAWRATGVARGCAISVRALAYVVAGHEIHHRMVLKERYLGGAEDED